ncbi:MAG: MMPL family transporter [Bacteroidia bacterium]
MWTKVSHFILRYRFLLLGLIAIVTLVMGYYALQVKMSYDFIQVTPSDDPDFKTYQKFKDQFGEDGSSMFVGFQAAQLWNLRFFQDYYDVTKKVEAHPGITEVLTLTNLQNLKKDRARRSLYLDPVIDKRPQTQTGLDSLKEEILSLPFYRDLLYNPETHTVMMLVRFDKDTLASKSRGDLIAHIEDEMDSFGELYNLEIHYSGMPLIRTKITEKVANEMKLFSTISIVITALILLFFFRSFSAMVFPLVVIIIIMVWTLGTISLFGYKLNILSGLLPPLIVIIGVPNFIYFLNKYHHEFKKHGNKVLAINRMVEKIGVITFLTNCTTAIGFGVLFLTESPILKEFGLVAAINIMATFFISVITIPVIFSLLPEPSSRHTNYLNSRYMKYALDTIDNWVHNHRKWVYLVTGLVIILGIVGVARLKVIGYMLDDIPHKDKLYSDLMFFEKHFEGVMPFEIIVDTKQKNGLLRPENLQKLDQLQDSIESYPEFARPMSVVEVIKFTKQAFYDGRESQYSLPTARERNFLLPYLTGIKGDNPLMQTMIDTNRQVARISAKMEDVGSLKLAEIKERLERNITEIFGDTDFHTDITGVSVVFMKNNKYLIESLVSSLILAFLIVSCILGLLFMQWRMILISIIPNFIPLLVTAGLMGFFDIALKPSTVLVFSIAFGISVDDALHFLAKYRQELNNHNWDVPKTVSVALGETGFSMIYTSLILFCGFSIFDASSFGGTAMLGVLTSITLLIAMLTNLVILPSLLLTFDTKFSKKKIALPDPE